MANAKLNCDAYVHKNATEKCLWGQALNLHVRVQDAQFQYDFGGDTSINN
jgi:hypothetical protein